MVKKPKFKPVITRIKLNPEQAVLTCSCYDNNYRWTMISERGATPSQVCAMDGSKARTFGWYCDDTVGNPAEGWSGAIASS